LPRTNYFELKLVFFLLLFISFSIFGANRKCEQVDLLVSVLENYHVEDLTLMSEDFQNIRKNFLQRVDRYNLFLTKSDVQNLLAINDDCAFVEAVYKTLSKSKTECFDKYTKILSTNLDLSNDESFEFYESIEDASGSKEALAKRQKQFLKYMVMMDMLEGYSLETSKDFQLQDQMKIQENVKEYFTIEADGEKEEDKTDRMAEKYLKAIANYFDPHSTFFSLDQKKVWDEGLTKEVMTFGVSFDENDEGEIVVSRLIPGGAAWKSGEIHEGDKLLAFQCKGEEKHSTDNMDIRKVNRILKSSISDAIELKLEKEGGQTIEIELKQEKEIVEDNLITSFILKGEKKIGYIQLPGFYSGFEGYQSVGCANDVAKELMKLKQEGIDGVILDLRYNGGGSMKEALELAGIFIDQGPLLVLDAKFDKPRTQIDRNRGAIYDGPMAVMVNGASASASEIVSMILQDYNRALILGGRTYGKATAQGMLPLDTMAFSNKSAKMKQPDASMGFVKITMNKIYSVKLNTYQKNGVQPDVSYPYVFEGLIGKESDEPRALTSDKVDKTIYNFSPLPKFPVEALKRNSKDRIAQDSLFQLVIELNANIEELNSNLDASIPLNIEEYMKILLSYFKLEEKLEKVAYRVASAYEVVNTSFENEIIEMSEIFEERNNRSKERLLKDIELEEAYSILKDLINNQ
jgi:carboxyl-terminal processing protease